MGALVYSKFLGTMCDDITIISVDAWRKLKAVSVGCVCIDTIDSGIIRDVIVNDDHTLHVSMYNIHIGCDSLQGKIGEALSEINGVSSVYVECLQEPADTENIKYVNHILEGMNS